MKDNDKHLTQWDNNIPPLNLWNYNLFWRWVEEWDQNNEKDLTDNVTQESNHGKY